MVDNIYIPARVQLGQGSVRSDRRPAQVTGRQAESEIELVLNTLGMDSSETRPAALRKIRDQLNPPGPALRRMALPDYGRVPPPGRQCGQESDDIT